MVDVAQLVEPRIVIPAVAGSSPVVHPTFGSWVPLGVLFLLTAKARRLGASSKQPRYGATSGFHSVEAVAVESVSSARKQQGPANGRELIAATGSENEAIGSHNQKPFT